MQPPHYRQQQQQQSQMMMAPPQQMMYLQQPQPMYVPQPVATIPNAATSNSAHTGGGEDDDYDMDA